MITDATCEWWETPPLRTYSRRPRQVASTHARRACVELSTWSVANKLRGSIKPPSNPAHHKHTPQGPSTPAPREWRVVQLPSSDLGVRPRARPPPLRRSRALMHRAPCRSPSRRQPPTCGDCSPRSPSFQPSAFPPPFPQPSSITLAAQDAAPSRITRLHSSPRVPLKPFQSAPDSGPRHVRDARGPRCKMDHVIQIESSAVTFSLFVFGLSFLLESCREIQIFGVARRFLEISLHYKKQSRITPCLAAGAGVSSHKRGIPPHTTRPDAPLCVLHTSPAVISAHCISVILPWMPPARTPAARGARSPTPPSRLSMDERKRTC